MIPNNIDSEADGLFFPWDRDKKGNIKRAATKVHCIDLYDPSTGDHHSFDKDSFDKVQEWVDSFEGAGFLLVGHNIIGYDLPLWKKLLGFDYEINMETFNFEAYPDRFLRAKCRFVDTLILSKILNPDRHEHSVEYFANKKGNAKVEIEDWVNLPLSEYKLRCSEDTKIQHEDVFEVLMAEARSLGVNIRPAYEREKAVVHIVNVEQASYGVAFNQELAKENVEKCDVVLAELAAKVEPLLPQRTLPKSDQPLFPAKPFLGSGEMSSTGRKFCDKIGIDPKEREVFLEECVTLAGDRVGKERAFYLVECGKVPAQVPMLMANQPDIKQWLMDVHGWEPFYWNISPKTKEKTSPKFHDQKNICPNLLLLGDKIEVVKDIMKWGTYRNRRNVILSENGTGFLTHPRLEMDGRLPAAANTIGAVTKRFTHKGVANIPRVTSEFGLEMRSMFCVDKDRKLVGWDASNLEGRVKAHACYTYPGGADYAKKLLDPDFDEHQENADAWDVDRGTQAKSGLYCLQYGGKVPTFSKTLCVPIPTGQEYYDDWWSRNKPLEYFKADLTAKWKANNKVMISIDGSPLRPRKEHALVNTWIQSAGTVIMKEAMVLAYREIIVRGLDSHQVIHYHDEQQNDTAAEIADLVGQIGCWSIEEAGRRFNLAVPMTAEYKIGTSWAETH